MLPRRVAIRIENCITIVAPAERVLALAERVEDWPRILPHYRRVDVCALRPEGRVVEMSAFREGVPIPVRWRALQRAEGAGTSESPYRVMYRHVGGVTRGMRVEWRIVPAGEALDVTIVHDFEPPWPWPGPWIARHIVCGFFVHAIADRTLAGIKRAAERSGATSIAPRVGSGTGTPHERE